MSGAMSGDGNPMRRPEAVARLGKAVSANHADEDGPYGEEWRHKQSEAQSRENGHAWRGGTSREPYVYGWDEIADAIRDRDGHRCVICGELENGRAHDVHHIDYDKKNNDPTNLVTLCKKHHAKTTAGDRGYWQTHFTGELYLGAC